MGCYKVKFHDLTIFFQWCKYYFFCFLQKLSNINVICGTHQDTDTEELLLNFVPSTIFCIAIIWYGGRVLELDCYGNYGLYARRRVWEIEGRKHDGFGINISLNFFRVSHNCGRSDSKVSYLIYLFTVFASNIIAAS